MKYLLLSYLILLSCVQVKATGKDSTIYYNLPDSIKAVQFMASITVSSIEGNKGYATGLKADAVSLSLFARKDKRIIGFGFPPHSKILAAGLNTRIDIKGFIEFEYNWTENETYTLLDNNYF